METKSDRLFVSTDWKRWIAENVLLDAPPEELAAILVREGFDADLARLEVDAAAAHPYIAAARGLARQLTKRDWFLHTQRLMEKKLGQQEIPVKNTISADEFYQTYCAFNRPVVLTDVIDHWPALERWTPSYLKSQCGDATVEFQDKRQSSRDYEIQKDKHRHTCRFAEIVDRVFSGTQSNDYYLTASNASANRAIIEKLWEDIPVPASYADIAAAKERTFFWLGPSGTVTPLHHDLTNNFMAQVHGRKRVRMISPANTPLLYNSRHCFSRVDLDNVDLNEFPEFCDAHIYDIILNPGELLFLPVGWWHHVTALDPSITITFTNFKCDNDFTQFYKTYGDI